MIEPAQGEDATVVSTIDVCIDSTYVNINYDNEHTQPKRHRCNFEAGVLREKLLANMVRWNTGTSEEATNPMEAQQRTPMRLLSSSPDLDMSHDIEYWDGLGMYRMLATKAIARSLTTKGLVRTHPEQMGNHTGTSFTRTGPRPQLR